MASIKLQPAVVTLIVASFTILARGANGEQPTPQEIAAYATSCTAAGKPIDLIAEFGTDFSGLDLRGISFRGAIVVGCRTNLRGADFSRANLQGADFGAGTFLEGANFAGAILDQASFGTAELQHANLQGASLKGTKLHYCTMDHANLCGVDLSEASLEGGQLFQHANFSGANLRGMELSGANFQNALLRGTNLSNCHLEQTDFTDADLTDAYFSGARVKAAIFHGALGLSDDQRLRLLAEAHRGEFELKRDITAFLDSPRFAIYLLFAVPAVALATGALRGKIRLTRERPAVAANFQFSLVALFSVTLAVCVFFGLLTWSGTGAFSFVAACAGYMMTLELVYGRVSRLWSGGTLAFAVGYALINIGLFWAAMNDAFGLFNPLFVLVTVIVGPLFAMLAVAASVVLIPQLRAKPPWTALAGLVLWMACMGWANLCVIAMAAASV